MSHDRLTADKLVNTMKETLASGETLKITNFGNFTVREKRARAGRDPKTGKGLALAARRVVTFRASRALRARLNGA
jgi:integration host factor subunit alpha